MKTATDKIFAPTSRLCCSVFYLQYCFAIGDHE